MTRFFILTILILFASCSAEDTHEYDTSVKKVPSGVENSESEIAEKTMTLADVTPNNKNPHQYISLINSYINVIGESMHHTDSLLNLLSTSQLDSHWQFSVDRTRLLYLCVLKDKDSAEVLTRIIYQKNNPERLNQSEMEYGLYYHLTYIKAIKGECDSAKYYNKLLNTTIKRDSTIFYEVQLEDVHWINTWLPEQCD